MFEIIKQSSEPDRRVKYDPSKIMPDEGMRPSERRTRARKARGLPMTDWQAKSHIRGTAEISGLAKVILEAVSPEDSQDEILELPAEVLLNIEERSSGKVLFITDAPYRSKPADEVS